jgi:hypothetical protein
MTPVITKGVELYERDEDELNQLLGGMIIAYSRVLPNIHALLFSKKSSK